MANDMYITRYKVTKNNFIFLGTHWFILSRARDFFCNDGAGADVDYV